MDQRWINGESTMNERCIKNDASTIIYNVTSKILYNVTRTKIVLFVVLFDEM